MYLFRSIFAVRPIINVFFLSVFLSSVYAQQVVCLVVSDSYTELPLERAWVLPSMSEDTLFTGRDGMLFDSDLKGSGYVVIGKAGYFNDTLFGPKSGIYRIYLTALPVGIQAVSIISERLGADKLHTPMYGFRQVKDDPFTFDRIQMAVAVNSIPGASWEQRGIGGSARISIRGNGWRSPFGIRGTRIYYEHIPFSQPDGFGLPEFLDPYFYDSFELFKGPAGAAYGGYAGGSLVMKKHAPQHYGLTFDIGVTAGSLRLLRGQAGATYTDRNFSVSLKGMSMVHKGYREQEYVNRKLYQAHAHWRMHPNHTVTFNMFYGLSNWGLPGDLTAAQADTNARMANPLALKNSARLEKEFVRGGITHTFRAGEKFSSELTVFGNWTDKYNPYANSPASSGIKDEVLSGGGVREVIRMNYGKKVPWHGSAGFEYQTETLTGVEFSNQGGIEGAVKRTYKLQTHLFFLFFQSTLDLPKHFFLDFGSHFVVTGLDNKYFNSGGISTVGRLPVRPGLYPYAGITKTFRDDFSVYVRYHNGYTTPTLNEMISDDGDFNTQLVNERLHQLEAGTRGQIRKAGFSWGVAGYSHFYSNFLVPYFPTPQSAMRFTNAGNARISGAEAEADWTAFRAAKDRQFLQTLWLGLRYAFSQGTFSHFPDGNTDYSGQRIPGIPAHKVSLLVNVKIRYGFAFNVDLSARSRIILNYANTDSTPGVFKGNMRLSWTGRVFSVLLPELFVGINNFTDTRDYSFFRINAPGGRYFNPDHGLFIYGGVNIRSSSLKLKR
jgi:iron complex outermembrane receptor protein